MENTRRRLFALVMFWTIATTVFTWLPLVRIMGRAEGYRWRVLGFSGVGTDGPFWIFIPAVAYAVALLFAAHRAPRAFFYPMLILWHALVTSIVTMGVLGGGMDASIQGQGLQWEFPLWAVTIPCFLFTGMAIGWVALDHRAGGAPVGAGWSRANTWKLLASIVLLALALPLFRAGSNYNWVTAVAIIATVSHWILLAGSFEPMRRVEASPDAVRMT